MLAIHRFQRGLTPIARISPHPTHVFAQGQEAVPNLLNQPSVGPTTATQIYIAPPHPDQSRNETASARLAGVAPAEASSGQNTRHRLNRHSNHQPNRAHHTIALTRTRYYPKTKAYITKRTTQSKTPRQAQRCLKRYIARHLNRLLEHPPTSICKT